MPKVSVILPVYNVAQYIEKCIESLLAQTLTDVEFIFVDDCSPDNSVEIIQKYQDPRIKVVRHETNKYTAEARNTGIRNATGEYISFVDPDDYIDKDFLLKLYTLAKKNNADIAKGIYINIPSGKIANNNSIVNKNRYHFHFAMWTAIYRKALIDKYKIKFSIDTICGQFPMVHFANKIVTCNDAIYYYVTHNNSCVNCVFSVEKWRKLNLAGADILLKYLNDYNISKDNYVLLSKGLILRLYQYGYDRMSKEDKIKYKKELYQHLMDYKKKNKYIKITKVNEEYKKVLKKYGF